MLTKGAIGNLVNRYRAVLKKCNLINTFGSLAVASMLVLGGAGMAEATITAPQTLNEPSSNPKIFTNETFTVAKTASSSSEINGGAIANKGHLEITDSIFMDNTITSTYSKAIRGSAIYNTGTSHLYRTDFKNNSLEGPKPRGGAILNSGTMYITDGYFNKNSLINPNKDAMGGAVYNQGTMTITSSLFEKNHSDGESGAIATNGGTIKFYGNSAESQKYTENKFLGNTAGDDGGAIDFQGSVKAHFYGKTIFDGNIADNNGGAISVQSYNGPSITFEEDSVTKFLNNSAKRGGAIASIHHPSETNGHFNTITFNGIAEFSNNTATEKGGAIYNYEKGVINFNANAVFAGNTAAGELNDIHNDGTLTVADSGTVYLDGGITGNGTIDGNGTFVYGRNTTIKQNSSEGYAKASAELNDKLGGDFAAFKQLVDLSNGLEVIGLEEGMIAPEIGADGKAKGPNKVMDAVLQQASINTFAIDRILTNDVRKRLGDIRSDANTTGVWMRWDGGKLTGHSGLTNDFNTIQIGGDTKVARNCRLGVSGSFTHGDADFARGNGELEGFSFAAYATWMGENGMFADVVARLGHFSTEMNVEGRSGDMDNRVASLSGEYGWRFNVCDQFFVEPQIELAYTYVNSEDLQLGEAKYHFDNVDSLTGRAGFVAGWNLPDDRGNLYARASVVQQFMGDAKVTGAVTGGKPMVHELDGEDTWLEYGIGANVKLTDKTYIWVDVERTEGAEIDEEWRGTVGIRFSF